MLLTSQNRLSRSFGIQGELVLDINFYWKKKVYASIDHGWLDHFENSEHHRIIAIDIEKPIHTDNNDLLDCHFYCPNKNGLSLYLHVPPSPIVEVESTTIANSIQYVKLLEVELAGWLDKNDTGSKVFRNKLNIITGYSFGRTKEGVEIDELSKELSSEGVILAEWQASIIYEYIKKKVNNGKEA